MDKAHILFVEDNPRILDATSTLLRTQGYRVTTATSVDQAIDCARDNPDLDVLITDYHLANGGTGRQVISAVRQLRGPTFKAIVLTGDTTSVVHAFDGDACLCWLNKPANTSVLLSVLRNFTPGGSA